MDDYRDLNVDVLTDEDCGLLCVIHEGKRMYFPRRMDERSAADYYRTILAEQDMRSPHCYRKTGYEVREGDVIVDAGGAEGFFTLVNLDRISKAYVFDADKNWLEAMEHTFAPYKDKVELCFGYVGDTDDGREKITLDTALNGVKVDYIKMDIEGYEKSALSGAENLIASADELRCAICSYHCEEDEEWISRFFGERGFDTAHSDGYMIPDWCSDGLLKAQLRRGVVFAAKG